MFILGVGRKRFFCMFFLATSVFKKTIFGNRKFFADLFISQIISNYDVYKKYNEKVQTKDLVLDSVEV